MTEKKKGQNQEDSGQLREVQQIALSNYLARNYDSLEEEWLKTVTSVK